MRHCGIVILAAGGSTRMGVSKQSLKLQGQSLLQTAVATANTSVCRPVVVVLGSGAEELKIQLDGSSVTTIINQDWARGMGTSIRAGVAAVGPVDAAVILLCDQPLITAKAIDEMVETHFRLNNQITAAAYADTIGTPVVFSSAFFSELMQLEDQQGGKALIHRYADTVKTFRLPEAEWDIDTPGDFARLRSDAQRLSRS